MLRLGGWVHIGEGHDLVDSDDPSLAGISLSEVLKFESLVLLK